MSLHLIIGSSGQVGEHLMRVASGAGFETIGTYHTYPVPGMRQLDIRNSPSVQSMVAELRPDVVYLPASMTNVDQCELSADEAYQTNVSGVRNVVDSANNAGAKLVYFSSDYIFDGKAGPYREEDPANPTCEYGRQKLAAEHYVALNARDFLIVRTTVVYGWERRDKNFTSRLVKTLKEGQPLRVPNDQIGNPTYAPNLAEAVVELSLGGATGVYHIVGPERIDRYQFACAAAGVFGLDGSLIQPIATSDLGQTAPRPLNAGMTVDKAVAQLKVPLLSYHAGLKALAEEGRLD